MGPRCLVEFQNGRVEEFLPGDSLTHESFQQPDVSAAIATAMAAFHVRMLARLPAAASQAAAGIESAGAAAGHSDGVPPPASPPAAPPLRPAIYSRIRQWHAAAGEVCAEELQQQGLGGLLEQVGWAGGCLGWRVAGWAACLAAHATVSNTRVWVIWAPKLRWPVVPPL